MIFKNAFSGQEELLSLNCIGKYIASGIHDGEGHAVGIDADRRLVFGWDVWSLDNPRCLHKVMNGGSVSKWHKLENK